MHDLPVPEAGLERHRRQRGVAVLGQDPRQRGVVIAGKAERDRAVIERQQRRHRRELGVGGAPFAGLIGDVGEAQAVAAPTPQVRHHLLAADREVDDEILQRFDLHDDQVLAARGAEAGAAGAQRRALAQPRHAPRRPVRPSPGGRSQVPRSVIPGVVGVVAERPELFDDGAGAEHLIERRRGEHARRRQRAAPTARDRRPPPPSTAESPRDGTGSPVARERRTASQTANGQSITSQNRPGVNRLPIDPHTWPV